MEPPRGHRFPECSMLPREAWGDTSEVQGGNGSNNHFIPALCDPSHSMNGQETVAMTHDHPVNELEEIYRPAFHGTSLEVARKVLVSGFIITDGPMHHLGKGVYFYEASFKSAKGWAVNQKKYLEPAVICSRIKVGKCLDFMDEQVQDEVGALARTLAHKGKPQTLASLVAYLCQKSDIDTVRAIQVKEDADSIVYSPGDPNSRRYPRVRTIICVKNPSCISSSELRFPSTPKT